MGFATSAALLGALIAAGPTAPLPASPTAREAFDRGRTAFGRAEYQRSIEVLHPLLYPDVILESEGEVVQARRMMGVAYLFENKPEEARREFRKLLELRPDYRFDPLLRPVQTTVAPASPSAAAIPRPAPRVAPATTATRPRSASGSGDHATASP
jgi:hypothetical protein